MIGKCAAACLAITLFVGPGWMPRGGREGDGVQLWKTVNHAGGAPEAEGSSGEGGVGRPMPGYRSLWALAALGAGAWVVRDEPLCASWLWFATAALLGLGATVTSGRACLCMLALAMATVGAGNMTARVHERARQSVGSLLDSSSTAEPTRLKVRAMLTESPRATMRSEALLGDFFRQSEAWLFEVDVQERVDDRGGWVSSGGRLRVRLDQTDDDPEPRLRAGDWVTVEGLARAISPPLNPGEPDRRAWAAQEGVAGWLSVPRAELIEDAVPDSRADAVRSWVTRRLSELRGFSRRGLGADRGDDAEGFVASNGGDQALGSGGPNDDRADTQRSQARALLGAMLLGERDDDLGPVSRAFTRLGVAHLVAISGLNMVLLAGLVLFFIRLTGDRGVFEPLTVAVVVVAYLLVLPAQAASLRGGIMVLALLMTEALGRRYDRLTVLAWVAVGLAMARPLDLFSPGYQLSFGIVGALVAFGESFHQRLFGVPIRGVVSVALPAGRKARFERMGVQTRRLVEVIVGVAKRSVSSAILAWLVATPLIAYHIGIISPLAVATGLVMLPLCTLVLWMGYVVLLLGTAASAIGGWEEGVGEWCTSLLVWLGEQLVAVVWLLDGLPGTSIRVWPWSLGVTLAVLSGTVWVVGRGLMRDESSTSAGSSGAIGSGRWGTRRVAIAATLIGLWLVFDWDRAVNLSPDTRLRIDTLAVGDGTCHLIRSGTDSMLWDCGSLNPSAGVRLIPEALRRVGAVRVRSALITHGNIDHFAALADCAESIGLERVLVSRNFIALAEAGRRASASGGARAVAGLLDQLSMSGVRIEPVAEGDRLALGHAGIEVLWPRGDIAATSQRALSLNDTSIIARFEVTTRAGQRSALFTGDAGRAALGPLLEARPNDVDTDVLELPHHGSFNPTAVELVRRSHPEVVLQSTGPRRARMPYWSDTRAAMPAGGWMVTAERGVVRTEILSDGRITTTPLLPMSRGR